MKMILSYHILPQTLAGWRRIYGEETPVHSPMSFLYGNETARFYSFIPQAHPCLIEYDGEVCGRCIMWEGNEIFFHDLAFVRGRTPQEVEKDFQELGILHVRWMPIPIPIKKEQWERIAQTGWIPYMDTMKFALVKKQGVFLVPDDPSKWFEENDIIACVKAKGMCGHPHIFRLIKQHQRAVYPSNG